MEREEALHKLSSLVGRDICKLSEEVDIRIRNEAGRVNKGWAGHTLERYLGLPLNSSQSPNFGSWELKLASLKKLKSGKISVKETIQVTMIDAVEVVAKPFAESHLYNKLRKQIVVARVWESKAEERSVIHSVSPFDLDNPAIYAQVEADYEQVREVLRRLRTVEALSGKMGILVQPRTKGPGGPKKTRAFYCRAKFVAHLVGIEPLQLD